MTLEDEFSAYSDCIIIILESYGAIAELGAFSIKKEIAEIVLAINDIKFKHINSFITNGPIKKINKVSKFKPTIYSCFNPILESVGEIEERLSRIKSKNRSKETIHSLKMFKNLTPKTRLFIISDLISLFSPISKLDLEIALKRIFFEQFLSDKTLDTEIALLHSLDLIYCYPLNNRDSNTFYIKKMKKRECSMTSKMRIIRTN